MGHLPRWPMDELRFRAKPRNDISLSLSVESGGRITFVTCMVRFFKKYDPRVALRTGRGFTIPFSIIEDDAGVAQWGVLATQDNYLIGELYKCIEQQRGGVQEIN